MGAEGGSLHMWLIDDKYNTGGIQYTNTETKVPITLVSGVIPYMMCVYNKPQFGQAKFEVI
jgi:hypothetical protein